MSARGRRLLGYVLPALLLLVSAATAWLLAPRGPSPEALRAPLEDMLSPPSNLAGTPIAEHFADLPERLGPYPYDGAFTALGIDCETGPCMAVYVTRFTLRDYLLGEVYNGVLDRHRGPRWERNPGELLVRQAQDADRARAPIVASSPVHVTDEGGSRGVEVAKVGCYELIPSSQALRSHYRPARTAIDRGEQEGYDAVLPLFRRVAQRCRGHAERLRSLDW